MSDTATLERPAAASNGIEIAGQAAGTDRVLTPEALSFLAALERQFGPRRKALLATRLARQARFDAGELPDFLPETKQVRASAWEVATIPAALKDRRVEITVLPPESYYSNIKE